MGPSVFARKSADAENQEIRIKGKTTIFYATDYQIPDYPKVCLINNEEPLRPNMTVIMDDSVYQEIEVSQKPEKVSFFSIFDESKGHAHPIHQNPLKSAIKKSYLKSQSEGLPAFYDQKPLDNLKLLFRYIGLDVENEDNYLTALNFQLTSQPNFDLETVRNNLGEISKLLDTYHKLKIQTIQGKTRAFLPTSYKDNLAQTTQNPTNKTDNLSKSMIKPNLQEGSYMQRQFGSVNPEFGIKGRNEYLDYSNAHDNNNNISDQFIRSQNTMSEQLSVKDSREPSINRQQTNSKIKTVPCRFFHSEIGCPRGEACHFIHNQNYKGVAIPNMDKFVRPLEQLYRQQEGRSRQLYEDSRNEGMGDGQKSKTHNSEFSKRDYSEGNEFGVEKRIKKD